MPRERARAKRTKIHNHTHAHANTLPKRTTVRVPRRCGTHLTFGVTKLDYRKIAYQIFNLNNEKKEDWTHTHAHANAPLKRTTVRVVRCRGTHLTFGGTKLILTHFILCTAVCATT